MSQFWRKFRKLAILVKILENLDFGVDFQNSSILVKIVENIDFGPNFRTSAIWVKIPENFKIWHYLKKNLNFIQNISILVQTSENLDFYQICWTIPNLVKIFEKCDFGQISEKSQLMSNFRKIRIVVNTFEK